jgi:uncharacterized protein YjiS (DUF1127 family)
MGAAEGWTKSILWFLFGGNNTLIGVTAPNVIWLGAVILILFTAYHAIKLFSTTRQLIKGLRYHEKRVADSIKNYPKLTGPLLDELGNDLASSDLLGHAWSEFRETLLTDDFGGEKLIFNTRAANEFFSKEDVLESNLKLAWYHAVPGVLTGLGLMFTFLAILVGLHGLVEPGSSEISQSGMIRLVESLSGKFLTSVCALALATLFVLLEKRLTNKAERAYKRFVRTLDARFPRRSSEYLLERIATATSEQATQLRHFGTDLSGRLKEGMTESFQPILERLALAIDKLEKEKSETLQGSMTGMLDQFKNLISNSAQGEISKLAEVLSGTSAVLQASNEQTVASHQKMSVMMDSIGDSMRQQAEANGQLLGRLTESVEDISRKLGRASEESSAKVAEKIQGVLTSLEESSFRTLEESKKHTQSLSQIVDTMSQRVEGALNGVSGMMTEKISGLLTNLEVASQTAAAEAKRQADSVAQLVQTMSERVEAALANASGAMSQTVGGLVSQTSQLSEATANKLEQMLTKQAEGAILLKQAGDTVDDSIRRFQTLLTASNETQMLYDQSVRNLREISSTVLDDLKLTRSVQADFGTVSSALREAGSGLSEVQSEHKRMLDEYDRVFKALDAEVGALIDRLHGNTQVYNQRVRDALVEKLGVFDTHLSSATNVIGGTVGELQETVGELNETLDQIRKTTIVSLQAALDRLAGSAGSRI